jgi:energy-coupling factor transporter ATP-binding protein EcfA2
LRAFRIGAFQYEKNTLTQVLVPYGDFPERVRELTTAAYFGPYRHALKATGEPYYGLVVGSELAARWTKMRTSGYDEARKASKLQKLVREIFEFDEFEIIPTKKSDALLVLINGETFAIGDVGSGLSHFIVLMLNILLTNSRLILVDEPESGLHPRLQIDLLTAIVELSGGSLMYATHSLGLARLADRSYVVGKDAHGSRLSPLTPVSSLTILLGEMSYAGNLNMGCDGVLLVEGEGDVNTYRVLLRLLRIEHEYVILSLGGSGSINGEAATRLSEVRRLGARVFAVIDSERDGPEDDISAPRKAFVEACRVAGVTVKVLERRCTESYLTVSAIEKSRYAGKWSPIGLYGKVPPGWPKADNWLIAAELTRAELLQPI